MQGQRVQKVGLHFARSPPLVAARSPGAATARGRRRRSLEQPTSWRPKVSRGGTHARSLVRSLSRAGRLLARAVGERPAEEGALFPPNYRTDQLTWWERKSARAGHLLARATARREGGTGRNLLLPGVSSFSLLPLLSSCVLVRQQQDSSRAATLSTMTAANDPPALRGPSSSSQSRTGSQP